MKTSVIIFVASSFSLISAHAGGDLKKVSPARPIMDAGIETQAPRLQGQYIPGLDKAMLLDWVAVDSMPNAFGPALSTAMPMAYDPGTGVLAVIHRGASPYAAGSGQLWYNISHDGGTNWRRAGELNGGTALTCRYPGAAVVNPTGSADTSQCYLVYAANSLGNPTGGMTYGVDFPLGGGAGMGIESPGFFEAGTTIWAQPGTSLTYWVGFDGINHVLWRTNDYSNITTVIPPSWHGVPPYFLNSGGLIVAKGTHAASYYAVHGLFYPDSNARAFNAGYSKSTDSGATWSGWNRPQPDWMAATGLPPHYDLYDYAQPPGGTALYLSDMLVDANERIHFFHVVVDSPWTSMAQRGILEVYETGTGWAYKWVTQNLNPRTALGYPGSDPTPYLDQTGNAIHASISADGRVMAIVWLDAGSQNPTDTLPDIWFSVKQITGSSWYPPINLTQTPHFAELMLHAAPIMEWNGFSVTIFLGRSYQCNINTYPPDNGAKTTFYAASYTPFIEDVGSQNEPTRFALEQNYPNPFNPNTKIQFTIPVGTNGRTSLRVYDLLGREVATLVNDVMHPGTYDRTFDGTGLASGVYICRLESGSFSQTRKLLLVR